jgi:UDP-glucuronate decarboxylase
MKLSPYSYDLSRDVEQLIDRSGIDIEQFRGRTVFVTGGTGFFGIWLLSALVRMRSALGGDLTIIVLSRDPESFLRSYPNSGFGEQIEFIRGDVKNFILDKGRVTDLVHMATTNASETYAGEDQLKKLDLLYRGTCHVLEQCGESLERALFTSSGVVYGRATSDLISEDDATGPATTELGSALAIGKLAAEYALTYYSEKYRYKYAIARCFAFAGQYLPLDIHYAFGNFIKNVMDGKDVVIKGDGRDMRSYLYIGDAIAWILRLLMQPDNQVYNVGSSKSVSMETLAKKIVGAADKNIGVSILGGTGDTGNFRRASYSPTTQKINKNYPGLKEWTDLDEIIKKMLAVNIQLAQLPIK